MMLPLVNTLAELYPRQHRVKAELYLQLSYVYPQQYKKKTEVSNLLWAGQ